MDPVQLVIIIVSLLLTGLIIVLSIQVWHILKEIRFSFTKINKMLDDFGSMTGSISESVSGLTGLVSGLKAGMSLFSSFRKGDGDDE